MKSKLTKIAFLLLVVILITSCFVACNKEKTYKITIMDGEREVTTIDVTANGNLSKDDVLAKVAKDGYEFVGLYTDTALTDPFVFENEVVTEITLYAKYTQKQLYISVKSQEGMSTIERIPVTKGAEYSVPSPTMEGYTFTGYTYEDDDGNDAIFPQTGTYTSSENTRLTAHFTKNVYVVKFHNGDVVTEQSVEHGNTVVLTPATKSGYTFADWRLEDATEAFAATTPITSNVDLYANFTPNTYTVTFATDLGLESYRATYGAAYELTAPTKAGKSFLGFKRNGAAFAASGIYDIAGDIYLTADWADLTYDVTFLAADETELAKQSGILYGAKAQAITVAGYTVKGYYLDKEFSEDKAVTLANYPITAATTLYVKTEGNLYTLTVDGWHEATIRVRYGETYTLIAPTDTEDPLYIAKIGTGADNEWSAFTGYTYEDEEFPVTGTYTWANNITVTPLYVENDAYDKATVTFRDTVEDHAFGAATVTRGATVAAEAFPDTDKVGYDFLGWFTTADYKVGTEFNTGTPVNANVTAYAKYVAHSWTLTVKDTDAEGETLLTIPVTFGQAFDLPASIAKRGYSFDEYSEEVTSPYAIDGNKTIYATFTRNEVTVSFLPDALAIEAKMGNQYDALSAFLPADPVKEGYTFKWWSLTDGGAQADYDAEVDKSTAIYAVFEANEYTITYEGGSLKVTYGQAYALPATLVKAGYTFVKYTYDNGDFPATGTYAVADDITLTVVWQYEAGADFVADAVNGYFKERENASQAYTYVFLAGRTYSFAGYTIASESELITLSGDTAFRADTPGAFSFEATNTTSGLKNTINAKIVYDIKSIGLAGDYEDMIAKAGNSANFQKTTTEADYVMSVGLENFIPEISVLDADYTARTLEEANISITEGDEELSYTLDGSAIDFATDKGYASAGTKTLTFAPKYAFGASTVTLKVNLNTGVNVYTNLELKAAYSDLNVHGINILRNITAELVESDYESGYGERGDIVLKYKNGDMTQTVTLEDRDLGKPKNVFGGGVYTRSIENSQTDNVVVNGNYFSIDGSKLPYVDDALNRTAGVGYDLSNVQIGIFLYRCCQINDPGAYDDMSGVKYVTATATMNNLRIEGNNIPQYAAATSEKNLPGRDIPYLKMSASYDGIIVRGGTLNMNNTTITNMNLGMMLHGGISGYYNPSSIVAGETQATRVVIRDSMIDNCYTNSIYNYDLVNLTIMNTRLGKSASAALHFDDRPYGGAGVDGSLGCSNMNSVLVMDTYTASHINNWVAGTEPWFVAYNQTGTATTIKTDMEAATNIVGMSILREYSGAQMMNFGIVVFPTADDKTAAWQGDKDGHAALDAYVFATNMNAELGNTLGPIMAFRDPTWTTEEQASTYQTYLAYAQPADNAIGYAIGAQTASDSGTAAYLQGKIPGQVSEALPKLAAATGTMQLFFATTSGSGSKAITVFIPCYYSEAAVAAIMEQAS